MDEYKDILSKDDLLFAETIAHNLFLQRGKHPHDNNFASRCWLTGLMQAFKRSGYVVCLKKKDTEIVF
jgi:hypothetical protein